MDNLRGSLFMILAMALFAVEDALIKLMAGALHTGQITLVLGLIGATVFSVLARRRGVRLLTPALWSTPIVIRNLAEIIGVMAFVTALARIPLATTAAFIQATPLLMTLAAALFLREPVGWRRWTAVIIGLIGVLIILRPGTAGFDINAVYGVIGVICLAARDLGARYVGRDVHNLQLSVYGFASLVPAGLLLLLLGGDIRPITSEVVGLLLLTACFGITGYYTITIATRIGDVSTVTPFRYTRLIFAMLIGLAMFGERPDAPTMIGAAIVMATGLYTLWREARLRRRNSL
ncbi:MAG: DMT family transporter [Roseivivax sp.]|nr:DMT family transporter [Roseivivax sp.]